MSKQAVVKIVIVPAGTTALIMCPKVYKEFTLSSGTIFSQVKLYPPPTELKELGQIDALQLLTIDLSLDPCDPHVIYYEGSDEFIEQAKHTSGWKIDEF